MGELDHRFESVQPERAPEIMAGYPGAWWVSGGWALELVGGSKTRDHLDLDIGVYREDLPLLLETLDFELHSAAGGILRQMSSPSDLPGEANSIWARRRGEQKWLFELMLDASEGEDWAYRRDPRIRLPKSEVSIEVDGIPCLKPEIQLLYKAKRMRDRDIADFGAYGHRLHPTARAWLKQALGLAHPGHPWIDEL